MVRVPDPLPRHLQDRQVASYFSAITKKRDLAMFMLMLPMLWQRIYRYDHQHRNRVFLVEKGVYKGKPISVRGIQKRIEYYSRKSGVQVSCHQLTYHGYTVAQRRF